MILSKELTKETLELWEQFRSSLVKYAGDAGYDATIREKGFEVKNMYFADGKIAFGIVTTHRVLIPYAILGGGYHGCMSYIIDEILEIRNLLLAPE